MDEGILKEAGIAYEEGVKRFAGKAFLYEKHMKKFVDDETFSRLKTALENQEYDKAFRAAHDLKGVTGNLSLNALYKKTQQLTEGLRDGKDIPGVIEMFPGMEKEYESTVDAIRRCEG